MRHSKYCANSCRNIRHPPLGLKRTLVSRERDTPENGAIVASWRSISSLGGTLIDYATIQEIRFEAALIDLPISEVELVANRQETKLVLCDCVMFLRAQSSIDIPDRTGEAEILSEDSGQIPNDLPPIAASFDGVPIQNHQLLNGRLDIDDPDDLEAMSVMTERYHGTSMASLILHGDKNLNGQSISRRLHVRPILYAPGNGEQEHPRLDRLLVDAFHSAVRRMKGGDGDSDPTAPNVFPVNVSIARLASALQRTNGVHWRDFWIILPKSTGFSS